MSPTSPWHAATRLDGVLWWARLEWAARDDSYPASADSRPQGRSPAGSAGAGGRGARALASARRVRAVAAPARGRQAVDLLRGPTDGERPAGLPPRALARVQGHLPALSDDARLSRGAQGRLGLPRPAGGDRGGTGAWHQAQVGDRGVRDRAVQREVPRVGVHVPGGGESAGGAPRFFGRAGAPMPHPR